MEFPKTVDEVPVVAEIKVALSAFDNLAPALEMNCFLTLALVLRKAGIEADTRTVGIAVDELAAESV